MKTLLRGLGPAFLMGALLGLAGCAPDNESEAQRLQAKLGAPPTTDVKGVAAPPGSSSYEEYAQRRKEEFAKNPQGNPEYAKKASGGATTSGRR